MVKHHQQFRALEIALFFIDLKCLIFDKRLAINEMNHVPPFEQVLGLGIIGTLASIIDMNEALKFLILLLTFLGLIVKLWEQIKKSEYFLEDIKKLWAKFRK